MDVKDVIYTNAFQLTSGAAEIQLILKLETPIINADNNSFLGTECTNLADIRISPFVAKQLSLALSHNIREYENNYGKIPFPVNEESIKDK